MTIETYDMFSGGGGIGCAVEIARARGLDIKVTWAANHWPDAVRFHRLRHPDTPVVCQDLCQYDYTKAPGKPDLIWASFACQGNSEAAQPGRAKNDDLAVAHDEIRSTAWAVVQAVLAKQPTAFIAENVPEVQEWAPMPRLIHSCSTGEQARSLARLEADERGCKTKVVKSRGKHHVFQVFEKGSLWRHWLNTFRLAGYHITVQVVNCAKMGTAQRRRRLLVVGHLDGQIPIIEPKVAERDEPTLEPILDFDAGRWTKLEDMTKPGARARVQHATDLFDGGPCWGYHVSHKAAWGRSVNTPSTTVTTKNQHWSARRGEYRLWLVSETAQVMGFPADYFDGVPRTKALVMAGNAFPPPAGADALCQVAESLR